ncbi:hypothetical protein O181_016538 [Austropuccinia psidii MF-1]|uniref:Uncharacterized protein n=1 Tax=Austropuccinia psidii MF-1 TaxID=1389203 RepID=A0A9Q3C4I9_9BASI|nr:hypothetical protein [Austropuccinia psidii MF-1]
MSSYFHIKSFLGQEKTIEYLGGWFPFSFKDKVKKINNLLKNKSLFSIDQKKELEMNAALEKEGPVESTSSKPLPTGVHDPQIGASSSGQCLQYGQDYYGIHRQGAGKDEQNVSMQIIQEIKFLKTIINVELGKIDEKLSKRTLDIHYLKKNNKYSSEWHKSEIYKRELISNTCDRIESKYQVQDDKMEDPSTKNINDQLDILKNYV